jgi:hypothetical protein
MIYDGLAGLLRGDSQLAALIGTRVWFASAVAGQAYPDVIQYPTNGLMQGDHLQGTEPPWNRRISFECRAQNYGGADGAHTVGDHVIRILNNYTGVVAGEQISDCRLESDVSDYDETAAIRRRIIDFRVVHSPA